MDHKTDKGCMRLLLGPSATFNFYNVEACISYLLDVHLMLIRAILNIGEVF